MEPAVVHTEPKQSTAIMDVAPPPKAEPTKNPEAPPAEPTKTPPPKAATPKPQKTASAPVAAIFLAITFFLVLSALAYFAYTKTN